MIAAFYPKGRGLEPNCSALDFGASIPVGNIGGDHAQQFASGLGCSEKNNARGAGSHGGCLHNLCNGQELMQGESGYSSMIRGSSTQSSNFRAQHGGRDNRGFKKVFIDWSRASKVWSGEPKTAHNLRFRSAPSSRSTSSSPEVSYTSANSQRIGPSRFQGVARGRGRGFIVSSKVAERIPGAIEDDSEDDDPIALGIVAGRGLKPWTGL